MVHRGIATLSGAMMFCFLSLSQFDTTFFFLHFYESMIYLAIILMLFYLEDQWAYMLGMLAPSVWLLLSLASGVLYGALRQVVGSEGTHLTGAGMVTLLTAILALLMITFCARHWKREFAGLGVGLRTFFISLAIVIVYYGILIYWFGRSFAWS